MKLLSPISALCKFSALSLLATSSFLALADDTSQPNSALQNADDNIFYIGAKGGWVNYQNACESSAVDCDANDSAWGGFFGYQFHRNWGVEAGYNDFGQAVATYPESGLNNEYTGAIKGWEFSVKGNLPLTENLDLFGKAGTLKWDGDNTGPYSYHSDDDWAPMVGIGLEYKLTPSWVARVEYQYFDSVGSDQLGGSNIHFTSLGLSYRFGQTAAKKPAAVKPIKQVKPVVVIMPPKPLILPKIIQVVHFEFDSSVPMQADALVEVAERLNRYQNARVTIQGYTDSVGASQYNMKLSKRRAESVATYLKALGVDGEQISIEALGETLPEVDNETAEHRANNRRVYLTLPALNIPQEQNKPAH